MPEYVIAIFKSKDKIDGFSAIGASDSFKEHSEAMRAHRDDGNIPITIRLHTLILGIFETVEERDHAFHLVVKEFQRSSDVTTNERTS